jgi:hypothetical protein
MSWSVPAPTPAAKTAATLRSEQTPMPPPSLMVTTLPSE